MSGRLDGVRVVLVDVNRLNLIGSQASIVILVLEYLPGPYQSFVEGVPKLVE